MLPVRWFRVQEPTGYDMPRAHFNTKNSTRFSGEGLAGTAAQVARAVYPGTTWANTPDLVIFYDETDWQAGLAASSQMRSLNGLLLPTSAATNLPADFAINGSDPFAGAQALLVDGATIEEGRFTSQEISSADIADLLEEIGAAPRHAILVD